MLGRIHRQMSVTDKGVGERVTLFPYQRTGVDWLRSRTRALLADEMGLGKTSQSLVALPPMAAAVVVAPAVVAHSWAAECRKWRSDLEPVVLKGRGSYRWPNPGELLITTWACLPPEKDISPPLSVPYLIADEAHAAKNTKAQRTKRLRALSSAVLAARGSVWLLTGTPLLNHPGELWNVLQAAKLGEEAFGSWFFFARLHDGQRGRFGWVWGTPSPQVPQLLRSVMLRRRRADVLPELPSKTRRDVPVHGIPAEARKLADAAWEMIHEAVDLDAAQLTVEATRIEGAAFTQLAAARKALARAKIPAAAELVQSFEEAEEPVVVFSAHREPVEVLTLREGWEAITGSTSPADRGRIVEAFQAGRLKGIAGTIGAMGVGVTLTHAHHLVMVDLDWTPALNAQAEDRICRIGQTRGCVIHRLIARHRLDERVTELLTAKLRLIEASVERAAVS